MCHITTGAIIWKWKQHNFIRNRPRPGAPCKVSDREIKLIIRRVVHLGRATERPGINRHECFKANSMSRTQLPWPVRKPGRYWENINWSDETKIELLGWHNTHHVTANHPKRSPYPWRWELHGLEVKEEKSAKSCQNDEDKIRVDDPKHSQGNSPLVSE